MSEVTTSKKRAVAAVPATCGELVQGTWQGRPCLVSCPMDQYSTATVTVSSEPFVPQPSRFTKANAALQAGLARLGCEDWHGHLHINSTIPGGRGYGSSTADIGATLYALAAACKRPLPPKQAAHIAAQIEPSDGTLFPGLVMFDHVNGQLINTLANVPPLVVLVIDPGVTVDTLAFHQQNHASVLAGLAPSHYTAFRLLCHGLQHGDWVSVGEAATLSSCVHQKILFNPLLDDVLQLAKMIDALGVCRAHSGSLLGLLLDPATTDITAVGRYIRNRLPTAVDVFATTLVGGGPRYSTPFPNFSDDNHLI